VDIDFLLRRVDVDGIARRFRIFVPEDYDDSRAFPAVLFLHGAGERGSDSVAPTKVGIGCALEDRDVPYPAIVVFPQCPRESTWSVVETRAIAVTALAETANEFHIDPGRVALTGISMGAAGAWLLAAEAPDKFVSLAPICGWLGSQAKADLDGFTKRIAAIPTWIVHGDDDNIVPVEESRAMHAALERAGANVRYTELRGVTHNSWDHAYRKSGLLDWMIAPATSAAR